MSLHYRCRCGQEVTLRPREGMYLLTGVLVGVTILNTVLLFLLWGRVGDPEPTRTPPEDGRGSPTAAVAPGAVSDERTVRDETSARGLEAGAGEGASPRSSGTVGPRGGSTQLDPPESTDRPSAVAIASESGDRTSLTDPDPAPETTSTSAVPLPPTDPVPPTDPAPPAVETYTLRLQRPQSLDPSLLPILVESVETPGLDRTVVLLGAARWGESSAEGARERLGNEFPLLAEVWPDRFDDPDLLELAFTFDPTSARDRTVRGELAGLEQVWSRRWGSLLERARSDPRAIWRREIATARGEGPVDLVILVDLSESMEEEVARFRDALRAMVPEYLAARGDLRIGWVGYRDEVVDRSSLAAASETVVASLERWTCGPGGDVPEALDEALFEVFRVGGFEWRPGAIHRILVVGDAPPPYERIEGMVELARAAHEAPEAFTLDAVGIIREAEFPEVPAFRDLAEGTGGRVHFVESAALTVEMIWEVLIGAPAPLWEDGPGRRS